MFTDDISKPVIAPLNIYGESLPEPNSDPQTPSYEDYQIALEKSEYEASREKAIAEEKEYYKTIQSPTFEPSSPFNFTPEVQGPSTDWKPDYLTEFNENQGENNNSPNYSPDADFEVPYQSAENKDYFNKTYGATEINPIEPYVPDDSFMKELEKKEQAIKDKYANESNDNANNNENNNDNDTNQSQKGGGTKLDFSEINLSSDNLLSEVNLEGGSAANLSDLNNMTLNVHDNPVASLPPPEIKHITINLNNNPTQSSETLGLNNITESSDPTSTIDTNTVSNESLDVDVASTDDSALNDIPTENLIDNLDISTLNEVIL